MDSTSFYSCLSAPLWIKQSVCLTHRSSQVLLAQCIHNLWGGVKRSQYSFILSYSHKSTTRGATALLQRQSTTWNLFLVEAPPHCCLKRSSQVTQSLLIKRDMLFQSRYEQAELLCLDISICRIMNFSWNTADTHTHTQSC